MGNNDGFSEALANFGCNRVEEFDGGVFSFAFGNEIALKINQQFYILGGYIEEEMSKLNVQRVVEKL